MAKLYEKIVNQIKDSIKKGELKEDDKLPTEVDLAEKFNVSRITSKRALEELRLQGFIYRIQGSGSFVANIGSDTKNDSSTNSETNRIAIVLPFEESQGGAINIIKGASEVLNKNNCTLTIHSIQSDLDSEKKILNQLYEDGTRGIIYYPQSDFRNFEMINKLYMNNFPIVTIDKYFECIPISSVVSDNMKSSCIATKHLIDLGHKKIAFISDETIESAHSIRHRYFGYCRALKDNDIVIDESFVKLGFLKDISKEDTTARYGEIIQELMNQDVTAVVCINDYVASLSMRAAINAGFSIPGQISIVGYDDIELASHLQIPLTTVAQDFNSMGRIAAELLIENIAGEHNEKKVVLPTELIIRSSTRKIEDE
ncbi:MAG: GntR family transcriptional regulator [Spirochaetaceae bacterium]